MPESRRKARVIKRLPALKAVQDVSTKCRCGAEVAGGFWLHALHAQRCAVARSALQQAALHNSFGRHVALLSAQKQELRFDSFDKAFCSAWLDNRRVVVGTKCNQLAMLDFVRSAPGGQPRTTLLPLPNMYDGGASGHQDPALWAGMHALAISPNHGALACGGADVTDALILSLPSLVSSHHLSGHKDWIFGMSWISDEHLVTGARNGELALWHVPGNQGSLSTLAPQTTTTMTGSVVRDVKCDPHRSTIFTIDSALSTVTLWDPILQPVHVFHLEEKETPMAACINTSTGLCMAVGGDFLYIIDPRMTRGVIEVQHGDAYGMRSVDSYGHMVSCGGSSDGLSFYDLRKQGWLLPSGDVRQIDNLPAEVLEENFNQETDPRLEAFNAGMASRLTLDAGQGWTRFAPAPGSHDAAGFHPPLHDHLMSVYTHCFQPGGGGLFVAGGPLCAHLNGCNSATYGV